MKKKQIKEELYLWKLYAEKLESILLETGSAEVIESEQINTRFDKVVIAKDGSAFNNCIFDAKFIRHPSQKYFYMNHCVHHGKYTSNADFYSHALYTFVE